MGLSREGSKPLPSQNAVASSLMALTILHDHQRGGTLLGTAPRRDAAIRSRHLVLPMQDRSQVDQATGKIMDRAAAPMWIERGRMLGATAIGAIP